MPRRQGVGGPTFGFRPRELSGSADEDVDRNTIDIAPFIDWPETQVELCSFLQERSHRAAIVFDTGVFGHAVKESFNGIVVDDPCAELNVRCDDIAGAGR